MCRLFLTSLLLFFFTDTSPPEIYTLSLHDALPIFLARLPRELPHEASLHLASLLRIDVVAESAVAASPAERLAAAEEALRDRKSTRLNSSHVKISYAVFCLKKKKKDKHLR